MSSERFDVRPMRAEGSFERVLGGGEADDRLGDVDVFDAGAELLEVGIGFERTVVRGFETVGRRAPTSARALEDALEAGIDVGDEGADLGAGCAGLERIAELDELLEDRTEDAVADDVDGHDIAGGDAAETLAIVALPGDGGRGAAADGVGGRVRLVAAEDVDAAEAGVGDLGELLDELVDFGRDALPLGGAEGIVGGLDGELAGALEEVGGAAERGLGDVEEGSAVFEVAAHLGLPKAMDLR
ncbi:hypothetical protein O0235_09425 [Tepidiforma flava]|uniref:Uncharacterized protein n=1 Tax=Tepidiforma flava TaxID=3004094 RepID=A0ABY7M4B9_9CHLR|nr:hypothetical protein [Tepidiforma flava]WBL35007.1 hypothetical protein O0235_09425 [Tepidiforma flava]